MGRCTLERSKQRLTILIWDNLTEIFCTKTISENLRPVGLLRLPGLCHIDIRMRSECIERPQGLFGPGHTDYRGLEKCWARIPGLR